MPDKPQQIRAFALYSLPGSDKYYLIRNQENASGNSDEFIFHPFDSNQHPSIKIKGNVETYSINDLPEIAETLPEIHLASSKNAQFDTKEDYNSLINKGISSIESGEFRKIVLSRSEFKSDNTSSQLLNFLFSLGKQYPNAFKLLLHHPVAGTWLMASPELLLSKNEHHFKTMALAGTWPSANDEPKWTFKEFEEQGLVLQYILQKIKENSWDIRVSERYTRQSGPVSHLCNDIAFKSELEALEIAAMLHPTPAVAGLPTEKALLFIKENEIHQRAYYGGYSGFIFGNEAHFFVNLRCLQVFQEGWLGYAGGGIVAGSEVEKEWEETNHKLKTLWAVLEKM
jgi:isochorismate synthase